MNIWRLSALAVLVLLAVSCTAEIPTPAPTPKPELSPTPDLGATVEAAVAAALPTATPTPTPDIHATVEAGTAATIAAMPAINSTVTPGPTAPPELHPTTIPTSTLTPTPRPTSTPTPQELEASELASIAGLVRQVRPSVVRIQTGWGSGSGVIFDIEDQTGYVLTNHHVVEGASAVTVTVNDADNYTGAVLGTDSVRDLAVVRICCGSFQALAFGDTSALEPGDEVMAIGYALDLPGQATITRGIVSAIRYSSAHNSYVIQTDAAINPGNSGGPMMSMSGGILGINTFGYDETQSGRPVEGLSFAISAQTVQQHVAALRAGRPAVATPTATPIPTRRPTPEAIVPKLGGKLTVAINSFDTEIMDPHVAGKNVGLYVFNHSQDYLMGIEVDNTLTNAWGWAESWEQIDGSTWDITLKQDIIDHDGVNITAEDGIWNVTRWASDEAARGYNAVSRGWRNIFKNAEALDSHKFRINLLQDYAFVFHIIPPIGGADMYVFPKHSWVDNGSTPGGWEAAGYTGTGFVDMVDRSLGQWARHERFDDYYGDEEYQFKFREMEVILSAWDAPRLALVATGAVDIANMSGPYVEEIRAAGLRVDGPKAVDVVYLGIYQTLDPGHCTNKLNVRKAMNLAVDTETIRAGIWPPGIVTPAITAFTSPQDESWNPTLTPYGYDPQEARRLLAEEGCEGFRFDAYAYDFAAGPEMADMTDVIVTYLVAAGIDARFTPIDWATNSQKVRNLEFGAADGPASGGAHWQLGGRNFGDKIRVHGLCGPQGGSVCNLPNPETWRSRYLQYASIMDRDTRVARAQDMSKQLYDLYAGIPIAFRNAVWALDPQTICGDWKPIDGTPSHTMFNTLVPCDTW